MGKFNPKNWSFSDWPKFGAEVGYHMLISILMFIFQNSFHSYFSGKFGPKIWNSSDWPKFGTEIDYNILISILMFILSKFLSFIFSLGKFGATKSEVWQIKWNLVQGYTVYAYFDVYFFKIFFIHIFLANLVPKCEVLQIDWNLVHR